eukprot:926525-Pelagomonas_calceolata.AAC.2
MLVCPCHQDEVLPRSAMFVLKSVVLPECSCRTSLRIYGTGNPKFGGEQKDKVIVRRKVVIYQNCFGNFL